MQHFLPSFMFSFSPEKIKLPKKKEVICIQTPFIFINQIIKYLPKESQLKLATKEDLRKSSSQSHCSHAQLNIFRFSLMYYLFFDISVFSYSHYGLFLCLTGYNDVYSPLHNKFYQLLIALARK